MKKLLLLICIFTIYMTNAQDKNSDFFDHSNIKGYKVEVTACMSFDDVRTVYELNAEDAEELVGMLRTYEWEENYDIEIRNIGWQMYFFYERYYLIRITRPDGRYVIYSFQNDFPSRESYYPFFGEGVKFSDGQHFDRKYTEKIKGYFRKYITDFGNVELLDGEVIEITEGSGGYCSEDCSENVETGKDSENVNAKMTLEETRRFIELYNTGWDSSYQIGGNGMPVDDNREYILMYGERDLFPHSRSHHKQYGIEFTPEVWQEMSDIIQQAVAR